MSEIDSKLDAILDIESDIKEKKMKKRQQLSNFQTEQRMSKQTIDMQEKIFTIL